MWDKALETFLDRLIRDGTLILHLQSGRSIRAGKGAPEFTVTLSDPALPRRLCLSPEMALGEGYMNGTLTIAGDDLRGFMSFLLSNTQQGVPLWQRPIRAVRTAARIARQFNPARRARQNVAHHYDLSGRLYDLFLDTDRQYSCAYFRDPGMSLEAAQRAKKHHIAGKLLLKPGMRVLDIGCGWGGMAMTLARDYGARVTGITLSEEQLKLARERAARAGLSDRVQFHLMDYREVKDRFDRIVSVGMFEHVGVPHYRTYFGKLRALLTDDGVALVHTIGRAAPPGATSPWIDRYIFPGGYAPALSEVMRAVEKESLVPADIEVWRLHYAKTLHRWYDRFMARQDEARALYDERFCRMWRFYLAASEFTFRELNQVVYQLQLSRRQDAVPLTREYLYQPDRELAVPHAAE
jgi:cyclopropane-fatty-acyl-phospholipid synthase